MLHAVLCCASSAAVQHLADAGGGAQLADGLGLNLADALARDLWAGKEAWGVQVSTGCGGNNELKASLASCY